MFTKLLGLFFVLQLISGKLEHVDIKTLLEDDKFMHPKLPQQPLNQIKSLPGEETSTYWNKNAQDMLSKKLASTLNTKKAKNVILFLGDGMSIATVAATRAYIGQQNGKPGEETLLSFEEFPYSGLAKTYCVDSQVADSACTVTAYLSGIKANYGTIGVNAQVKQTDCEASKDPSTHVSSIAKWSQLRNKRTGLVTTAKVTHASPAGVYANTANRVWESDYDMIKNNETGCEDIAHQLVYGETGTNLNVIMGGGRIKMIPNDEKDEQNEYGEREDGINLINEWKLMKLTKQAQYVWNRTDLLNLPEETEYLLGLFGSKHCAYNLDATEVDPNLAEMTEAAIKVLSKGDEGFFLFVEGAKIDSAHHINSAKRALDETQQFSEAIKKAIELTDVKDTLIVVTSDHSHAMTYNGYPVRGNPILGFAETSDTDHLPYTTLSYANGLGYHPELNGARYNLTEDNLSDKDYVFPSMVPRATETHAGEDVGVYASGPWAHLFTGVIEQNVIPHLMAYASCVGEGRTMCD